MDVLVRPDLPFSAGFEEHYSNSGDNLYLFYLLFWEKENHVRIWHVGNEFLLYQANVADCLMKTS